MIIFGTRGVTTSPTQGTFHCPDCGPNSQYKQKRVRRFFTLYFIPLIPLDRLGEYIECQSCRGTYQTNVLQLGAQVAQEAHQAEATFRTGIRKAMIAMLLADGVIDDSEVATIQSIYLEIAGKPLDEAELRAEIAQLQQSGADVGALLGSLNGMLNAHGKELIIRAGFSIAMADGEFHDSEQALLEQMAAALEITPTHLKGILAEMVGQQPALGAN